MSVRDEFEKAADSAGLSVRRCMDGDYFDLSTRQAYEVWQAARAQGAEPVAYAVHWGDGEVELHEAPLPSLGDEPEAVTPLYAQPQSAGVPENRPLQPNRYGVDRDYFTKKLEIIIRDMRNYTPDELARSLGRLAMVADSDVMQEPEFSATTPQPADVWIKCSERLPARGEWISGFTDTGRVMPAKLIDNGDSTYFRTAGDEVSEGGIVEWQPLPTYPQPPREQGGE